MIEKPDVSDLMDAGQAAYDAGRDREAYNHWRRAAALDPHNETIWLALAKVVTTSEDRRACLENALAVNPRNKAVQNELYLYDLLESRTNPGKTRIMHKPPKPRRRVAPAVMRVFLIMVLIVSVLLLGAALQLLLTLL